MQGNNLDNYIAIFKKLARDTGYALDAQGTIFVFTTGLKPGLRKAILHWENQPNIMNKWIEATHSELQKFFQRLTFEDPKAMEYTWIQQKKPFQHTNRQKHIHPNNETVFMDVDPPVYTQVRKAYTEEDKNQFKKKGWCFNCNKQGHMAHECPDKKCQFYQPQFKPKFNQAPQSKGKFTS
jgi:Zinc knuckle